MPMEVVFEMPKYPRNLYPGLFMRTKRVHGIHSLTSYNRTSDNHTLRRERSKPT